MNDFKTKFAEQGNQEQPLHELLHIDSEATPNTLKRGWVFDISPYVIPGQLCLLVVSNENAARYTFSSKEKMAQMGSYESEGLLVSHGEQEFGVQVLPINELPKGKIRDFWADQAKDIKPVS